MLNNLVARFIGPFLSQYCKEINSNQIEIELRNGKAQVKDLVFQEDCFIHHHFPLYVKRGLINSLSLSISSDQCNIFIENLVLIGSEVFGSTLITENQFIETFSEKTFLKQILKSIINIFFDPSFDNLKKLFDNLTISIQKVHIRIEGLMNNKSLGIMFSSVNFYSVNDEFQKIIVENHPLTFSKKIDVKNFSIYFDTENKYPINKYTDSFESQMIMQIVNENEFVLNPISFDCVFKYNTEFNSIYDLKLNLGELKLTFNNRQNEAFQNLIKNIKTQRYYNFLDRPFKSIKSERSSTLWWCYSYRCIRYKKTGFQQLNIPLALDVLKKRKKFYKLWKDYVLNSERYKNDYNEFKNTLNTSTLALLRYYSSYLFSKDTNNHSKLFTEEDIVRYFEKAKEIIPSEFNILINSIQLDLNLKIEKVDEGEVNDNDNKSDDNHEFTSTPLMGLAIEDISLKVSKSKDNNKLAIETNSIFLNNYSNDRYRDILQIANGIKANFCFNLNDPNQSIQFDVSSISFVFDAKLISLFFKYFTNSTIFYNSNRINTNDMRVKDLIDSHIRTKLDLKITNLNFIIPYQEIEVDTPVIQISTDSIEVHSALPPRYNINIIETLYDKYEVSLNSVQMILNNKAITNKISVNSDINVSIIPFNDIDPVLINNFISPLEVNLTTFNFVLLIEIIEYLSDEFTIDNEIDHLFDLALPDFKVNFSIPSISVFFSYRKEDSPLYNKDAFKMILKDQTVINFYRKNQNLTLYLINPSGIKIFEYFASKQGNFLFTQKIELKIKFPLLKPVDVRFDFGDFELFAKPIPLNFIQVFAESPKRFDWKLHLTDEWEIEKILHKSDESKIKTNEFIMNINFAKSRIYFIEYNDNNEEKELFTVIIKHVLFKINHNQSGTTAQIQSAPPLATTNQFGQLWSNMISEGETSSSTIIVNIDLPLLAIDLDYFQVSISPILISQIIKFSLLEKNPYSHLPGDPGTAKYMTFDLHVEKVLVKIIYDFESLNYFELTITHSKYVTLKAPFLHQIALDSLQLVSKMANKNDCLLFKLQNVEAELNMKYLLKENINDIHSESFSTLLQKKGIQKWTEETIEYIESIQDKKLFNRTFFYFCELCLNCRIDYLFSLYSHEFARNISYLVSKLLNNIKQDKFIEVIKQIDEPLDFSIDLNLPKGEFLIVDQTEVNIADLIIDSAIIQVNPNPFLFNAKLNGINLIDNQNDKIIEMNNLNVKTIEDEIYILLELFSLNLKLKYLPDCVYYVMNCPLFSFVDELNNNGELTPTNLEMINKKIFISLNDFKSTVPISKNIFLFETKLDVSLTPKNNIVQLNDIQMFLNQRLMMKKFCIEFSNDVWDIEPISIYFSVFELHIIKKLIKEIKKIKMPPIFLSKKEAELKRREFLIKLQQIDLILTQPNLPFLILEIKPSTFKQSYNDKNGGQKIIEYNVEMLLKHENHSNYGIDTIIDPFIISVNSKTMNRQKFTYAHISPINIAISPYIISEILQIKKRYSAHKSSKQIYQDKVIFFQNDTGIPIDLYLINKETKEEDKHEINDNKPFQINNSIYSTDIKVVYLYKTVVFSIKDLCYPIFFDRLVIAYLIADFGIQTIHFSSPYIIQNELTYDIEVFINDYNIGAIKSKLERPIPLVLVSSLANGIKAAISPITATPSPPIKFKKPNIETKLYKFVDTKNQRNMYSSIYFSTDSQRSICYITFLPYAVYVNQLPIPVSLTLYNKYDITYQIGTNQSVDVSFLKDKKSKLKIKVSFEPFGESDPTEVHTFSNISTPSRISIKRENVEKCKIAVMNEYSKKTNTFQIFIFTPCILYNKTGALLALKDSKDVYYPFLNNICFYTPDEYPKKVPLRVLIKDVTKLNSVDINCMDAKSIQTFSLPFINNENVYLLLSATRILIPFENTNQFQLMVHFMIYNHLNLSVFLIPSDLKNDCKQQFTNHCKPDTKVPIVFTNLNGKFKLLIDGFKKCKDVNLMNQTTTVFRLISKKENVPDFLIQLDVIKEENGFCGHLSYPTFPSPTVVTNMLLNQSILVMQKSLNHKKYPMIVNSMTTTIFAEPQPFIEHELHDDNNVIISIKEIEFTVCFASDISPQKVENTNYFYEVRTTDCGDKMIIVGELNNGSDSISLLNHSLMNENLLINVHFNKIEISFIDNYMHELFLIIIKNFIFKFKKLKSITVSIDSLHVNDMCIASKSPVVICEKEPKFLKMKLRSKLPLKMRSFESLDIKLAPIHIFIDIKFVLDICFTVDEFIEHFKIEIDKQKKDDKENKLKRTSFYSLKKLFISPLHIEFTLVKSKGRLNRVPYPKKKNFIMLCLIKNIFVIPFETYKEFTAIEISNIRAPIHNFVKSLAVMYLNQISHQDIYNLIFRDSSFVNLSSTENFIDFIEDSFNESHQNKVIKIIAKPERIPRAFPLNRIISVSPNLNNNDNNNTINCRYSLAQFTFQKIQPYESLLLLVDSKSTSENNDDKVLALFNHYIVVLSSNLQEVKLSIKIPDFLFIDNQGNRLVIVIKNNQEILFFCDDDHESRLIVTIIKSIADRMSLFGE